MRKSARTRLHVTLVLQLLSLVVQLVGLVVQVLADLSGYSGWVSDRSDIGTSEMNVPAPRQHHHHGALYSRGAG